MPTKKPSARQAPTLNPSASRRTILWLASYPKSGNTWTRVFLANYLMGGDTPVPINEVHRLGMGDSVPLIYKRANNGFFDPSDYQGHLKLRDKAMLGIAANGADLNFVKTHNANDLAFGTRLIDPAYTRAAVYIVRDPRDVAISYARHYGITPSKACREISLADNTVAADPGSVTQFLGNWSKHVRNWTRARGFKVHTMRYEDMKADPLTAFDALLGFIGIPVDRAKVARAVEFSSFDALKAQETKGGFVERSPNSDSFFHSGTSGQWDGVLSDEDLAYMADTHGQQMKRFGYL